MAAARILVTVCARGGSKGVKGKNIRPLAGKPLLHHTLAVAKAWERTADIYVSTDSSEIADCAREYDCAVPRLRDAELASDRAGKIPAVQNAVECAERDNGGRYDYVVDLDVTAPLRTVEDIEGCFQVMQAHKDLQVVVSVCAPHRNPYFNMVELADDGYHAHVSKSLDTAVLSRQTAPAVYDMNASIYVYRRSFFDGAPASCLGPDTGLYEMPTERSWDIDHEIDFSIVEMLYQQGTQKS